MAKQLKQWEIDRLLEDAWLKIKVDEEKLFNPLLAIPDEMADNPAKYIFWIMSRPEYISFFASEILNIHLLPIQCAVLRELWVRKFPMFIAHRGFGKSFLLGLHAIRRMVFMPGRKIIITGAAFRQAKIVFEYIERIWDNAPLLRDFAGNQGNFTHSTDMWQFTLGQSTCKALPTGHDGSKIRGARANDIIADEFGSINKDVFETVIAGFGAVSSNPIENVKYLARKELAKQLNLDVFEERDPIDNVGNQVVISGTAYYTFNHFYDYWKMWKDIVMSKGNLRLLEDKYGKDKFKDDFNYKDYSVMRIPYGLLPKGYMDDGQITRARATIHAGTFQMEYCAIFANDSTGFFKRSLIEKASLTNKNKIVLPSGEVFFEPRTIGDPNKKYVYGIDPASEVDNFSIIILECHADHRRIVYGWTTNKKTYKERQKMGLVGENDFYQYVARKIRNLMKIFPCSRMAIDAQGGGIAVMEALNSTGKILETETNIWPVILDDKEQDTDGNPGEHIIDVIQFADAAWVVDANHNLKMDFQNQQLIFPYIDAISSELAANNDPTCFDGLEDCILEIEELKNELCTIIHTRTNISGRDRWDTPERLEGTKKGRMRKDRYSSLLMANQSARDLAIAHTFNTATSHGGWAEKIKPEQINGPLFVGPAWFTEKMRNVY